MTFVAGFGSLRPIGLPTGICGCTRCFGVRNHKLVYRLYTEKSFVMRRKRSKRRARSAVVRQTFAGAAAPDERWGMDFVHDQLASGRSIRCLTIADHYSRDGPAIEVRDRLGADNVVRTLERLRLSGRKPRVVTCDNGSECCSKLLDQWAYIHGVELDFIRPGKPVENAFTESFNGRLREECLNVRWFETLEQAKAEIEAWRLEYIESRPHGSLGKLTPREYRNRWSAENEKFDAAFQTN